MLIVKVEKGKSLDSALKELKYKVNKTKLVKELRDKQYYEPKSVTRRFEILKASYIESLKEDND